MLPHYRESVVTPSQLAASICTVSFLLLIPGSGGWTKEILPLEPDLATRIDEHYDHEARLFLMLYSLNGNGQVDYVTGRLVQEYARSNYGNPVYQTEAYPLFYWWNHTMYNDPEQDGVNGNERVYQENVEFDVSRYKPAPSMDNPAETRCAAVWSGSSVPLRPTPPSSR
ncbi:MAG: hypothetical protein NTZ28_04420 [Nitrospirae bacterium]|nr:hypothetical protein [Nitrospirota bacterium]